MKIRFQADADLNQVIVKAVQRREPSIVFQTALLTCLACKTRKFWRLPQEKVGYW